MIDLSLRRATKLTRLLAIAEYRRGLWRKVAAAVEHRDAMRCLDIGTIIDVGANLGQFSLLARSERPDVVIHAFEPLKAACHRFEKLFAGDPLTTLHPVAAGEVAGQATINVSARSACSSLLPISALQDVIFPGTAAVAREAVRIERIDDVLADAVLPDPILVKLDVQGSELSALKGMPRLLGRAAHVYSEVSFVELYEGQPLASEVIAWLATQGLGMAGVHNLVSMRSGATVQADMLFSRRTPPTSRA